MPKLSPPSDGATSAFAASSSSRQLVLRQEAEHVDARRRGTRVAREHEPDGERVGADDPQPGAGPPADLRPGAQQHRHPLARLVPADEDDAVLAPFRVGVGGTSTPFGTTSYSPGSQRCGRVARLLRDGDPVVEPVEEKAPEGCASFIQPRSPAAWNVATIGPRASASAATQIAGVIGSCRWSRSKRSRSRIRGSARRRAG